MTSPDATLLPGLPGDNPLGFLAALGVQVALATQSVDHRMHWTDDPIPHPVLTPALSLESIARAASRLAQHWLDGPAFSRDKDQTLKLDEDEVRKYLEQARHKGKQGILATCLIAEGSIYQRGKPAGKSKPTDFYFTAARQQFLAMARSRLVTTCIEEIVSDIGATWQYKCTDSHSLMWDLQADRHHAHSAADPNDHKANPKETNAGAEALAILGLSCFPCFSDFSDIMTTGIHRDGRFKYFIWPLWTTPATMSMTKSLLGHVQDPSLDNERRHLAYSAWGIVRLLQSQIRSRGQGFRTFGPPTVMWQRE